MKIALNHERRAASSALILLAVGALAAALGGCAKPTSMAPGADTPALEAEKRAQRVLLAREIGRERDRIFRVGHPLLAAAAAECPDTPVRSSGLDLAKLSALSPEQRNAVESLLAVSLKQAPSNGLLTLSVAPGSSAEAAGLKRGDVITAAFDEVGKPVDLAKAKAPGLEYGKAFGLPGLAPTRVERWRSPVVIGAGSADTADAAPRRPIETVALSSQPVCGFAFALEGEDALNAYADGERMIFTRGMLRFAVEDIELATVIAHEIAHNQRGHLDAKRTNQVIGMVGGGVLDIAAILVGVNTGGAFSKSLGGVGAGAYSQSFETEADYVGMYLLRRAGHDTALAPNIWRRMAASGDGTEIAHASSHPTSPERFIVMTRTHEEILAKESAGEALTPNEDEAIWAPEPSQAANRIDSTLR